MAKTMEKVMVRKDSITTIKVELPFWKRFLKEWGKVKDKAPDLEGAYQKVKRSIDNFWEGVDEDNPIKLPVSLGTGHIEGLQKQLDRLTGKARRKEAFEQNEKDFLVSLYRWIAVGGVSRWYPEASQLLWHYMDATGNDYELDPYVYQSSAIVKYAMEEMKKAALEDIGNSGKIRNDGNLQSVGTVKDTHRNGDQQREQGNIFDNGMLLAEQKNSRLKNTDNRFRLDAACSVEGNNPLTIRIAWSVRSIWDYASFEEQEKKKSVHITELPLSNGAKLKLHDGLSAYLVDLGLAREFRYFAQWEELWVYEG